MIGCDRYHIDSAPSCRGRDQSNHHPLHIIANKYNTFIWASRTTMRRPLHLLLVLPPSSTLHFSNADSRTTKNNIINIDRSLQDKNPQDSYCGSSWPDAFESCPKSCPGGDDSECQSLGIGYKCFGYTGCTAKLNGGGNSTSFDDGGKVEAEGGENALDNYCGENW